MIHITDSQTDIILGFIQEDEFWDDKHYKSLKDTLETYDFTTFADRDYAEHLAKRNRIIIPDEDGKYVEFVIENTRKYRDSNGGLFVEVYTSATYIELAKAKIIKPQTTPAWTAKQHAEWALAGTEWEVGDVDFSGSRTLTIEQHTNPYAYLKRLATEFDLELHFRVETDGTKVVRRYVDLIERVGVWQGREVELGKDLIGIERKEDFSNIVTALIGLGPERENGTRLEVFVEDKDALARWGRNGQHLVEVYEPESTDQTMTEARLRELTQNELEKRINSTVEYTADIADLEKVPGLEHEKIRFGDTLRIKDTQFVPPLYLEARVHTMERSIKKNGYKTVTLGDYIEYTEEEVMAIWKSLKAEIAKKVSMSDVTEVVYTKPEVDSKDAGVYQDSTYYADNVSETKKQEAIQVAAVDATNKANTAEQNAKNHADSVAMNAENNAKNHADSVAEQKKQEAIQQAVADAETKINTAKMELEADIALKADAEWVNGQLQLKENAIHRGATAPTDTTKLWLDTSVAPNVLKRYDSATSSWVKATPTTAGEVNAYTKTEVDNALNSKVSVTQYNTDMNGVITRLDSAESRITQTENEIATKVSNTQYQQDKAALESDISALETRVTNAETSITQNANQIALKANKTDVYTKTEIDSQFSTVNQQISQLDAELTVQADQISQRVTKTEFLSNIPSDSSFEQGTELWSESNSFSSNVANVNATVKKDGLAGGNVLELTGTKWVFFKNPIPVDTSRVYRVRFRVRQIQDTTVGDSRVYAGVATYDKNGNLQTTSPGTHRYCAVAGVKITVADGWKYFEGTITGEGNTSHNQFRQGTAYVKPMFIVNYSGGNGVAQVDLVEFKDITEEVNAKNYTDNSIQPVNTRLSTAETSITQLSNQIQLKAEQTTVDTLANRISSAESSINLLSDEIQLKVDKDGVISAINLSPETAKLQASKIELDGYVEAKHIKSLNGLNVNNQFIVDSQGNVKFAGHLQGATGVFSGEIKTKKLRVRADSVHDFYDFGLEIETAQWQPDLDNPFVRTGFISFNTKNDALEIYRIDNNGNYRPLQGFLVEAERVKFTGDIIMDGRLIAVNSVIIESNTYSYLRPENPNNELRVANSKGQWSTVRAYTANPSSEKWKTDIKDVDFSAIEVLKQSKIYSYIRDGKKEREIGFIIERETPDILKDGEGVNSYSHSSLNTLAIQELIERVENIEERLERLENGGN